MTEPRSPRPPRAPRKPILGRLTPGAERNLLDTLRGERVGGVLLMVGAVVGLLLANGPAAEWFAEVSHTYVAIGPVSLSVSHWAADGLLAIFFFVIGLELTREFQVGELRRMSTAIVPMVGAVGGMLAPALIYVAINASSPRGDLSGWAVPTATDIAFAVAVLGLVAKGLPVAVRAFLLTLAVVDDLLAIVIIAIFFSDGVSWGWLAAAVGGVVLFAALVRTPAARSRWMSLVLVVVAVGTWVATLNAGVHATLAGVALGLVVPAVTRGDVVGDGSNSLAERFEHRWRPLSAGVAVPIFALFTAGVVIDPELLGKAAADPVAWGVVLGLVLGKPLGITGATWLLVRFSRATLAPGVSWRAIGSVSLLAGIGFTVSLLIGSLAFAGSERASEVVIAVMLASLVSALLGAVALRRLGAAVPEPAAEDGSS